MIVRATIFYLLLLMGCTLPASCAAAGWADEIILQEFELKNQSDESRSYLLDFSRWAYVDFHYQIDGEDSLVKRTGRKVPYRKRDFPFGGKSLIEITLEPGQTLRGTFRLKMQPYVGPPPFLRSIEAVQKDELLPDLWLFQYLYIVVFGLLAFLLLYNTILFLTTGFRHYRFYLLGLLAMLLESAREGGMFVFAFQGWESYPLYENYFAIAFNFAQILFAPLFIRDLLNIPHNYPQLEKLYRYFPHFCIGGLLLAFLNFELIYPIAIVTMLFLILGNFALVLLHLRRGYPRSRAIFIGTIIFLVFTLVHWAGNFGITYIEDNLLAALRSSATVIFDTFMAFILTQMLWDLRKRNDTQRENLIQHLKQEKLSRGRIGLAVANARQQARRKFAKRLEKEVTPPLQALVDEIQSLKGQVGSATFDWPAAWQALLQDVQHCIDHARNIGGEMMPFDLQGAEGLPDAVEAFLAGLQKPGLAIEFGSEGHSDLSLPIRVLCYRIIREFARGALEKTDATRVGIFLAHEGDMLFVTLEHNGKKAEGQPDAYEGIRANVSLFDGRVWKDPEGEGDCLSIQIPTPSYAAT